MSDFAEQPAEEGLANKAALATSFRAAPHRRNIAVPPPSSAVTLKNPIEAPRWLALAYNACIPCRQAVSRCDGHENYTQSCTQCRTKGLDCIWALSRRQGDKRKQLLPVSASQQEEAWRKDGNAVASTSEAHLSSNTTEASATQIHATPTGSRAATADKGKEGKDETPSTRRGILWRFPERESAKKGHIRMQAVPSAGWEHVGKASGSIPPRDVKGKGKARVGSGMSKHEETEFLQFQDSPSSSSDGEDVQDGTGSNFPDDTGHSSTERYEAILSQLSSTQSGTSFLETSSYASLLRSIFAEESSDLSHSLHWWEFSRAAKSIRTRWPVLPITSKKQWKKMSDLDKLLSENTYNWALWPRPPRADPKPTLGITIYPPTLMDDARFLPNLPEAIVSTALEVLSRSSLPDDIINGMTRTHIHAWTQSKRDHGFPATIQAKDQWQRQTVFGSKNSKYAIQPSSPDEFAARYLNRDELMLDIAEEVGTQTASVVQHAVDSVLLKIAMFREPKGLRKTPQQNRAKESKSRVAAQNTPSEVVKQKKKGKGKEKEKDKEKEKEADDPPETASGLPIESSTAACAQDSFAEHSHEERAEASITQQHKKDKHVHPPVDWQKVLLAAITVPGLPRR